ncbi:MAG: hypothetical protein AB8F78_13360 [Saprospiraceae bacterium]
MQKDFTLDAAGKVTQLSLKQGLTTFREVCEHLFRLPYRRPSGKTPESVFVEGCGTCSSKHSVLKTIAEEHGQQDIELVLCVFRMANSNTPKIGKVLRRGPLSAIPEAHNYIRWGEEAIDITKPGLHVSNLQADILEERVVSLEELTRKSELHRDWLKSWLKANHPEISLEAAWEQREACIEALAES